VILILKLRMLRLAHSRFFARIKLTSGGYLKMERRLSRDSADHGLSHQRAKPIILAVDDDADVIEAVIQDLRRRYGASFRLLRATSGQEGLEILQKAKAAGGDVALILSDQRMPGIRGVEFLSLAAQYYPLAKIALLTAYLDAEAAISAINVCKIDYYLMKPWDPPEEKLYPVIDELLAAWQPIRGVQFYGS
jgi:thioredoxin reductase (NADPH)